MERTDPTASPTSGESAPAPRKHSFVSNPHFLTPQLNARLRYDARERDLFREFSFENLQEAVAEIRKTRNRRLGTSHPRLFVDSLDERRTHINQYFTEPAQKIIAAAESSFGKDLQGAGYKSTYPPAAEPAFACAWAYLTFPLLRVRYKKNRDQYGREAVRLLGILANTETEYVHTDPHVEFAVYDWCRPLISNQLAAKCEKKFLRYAACGRSPVLPFNNPPGARLIGALVCDSPEREELLNKFYDGMVFGDPADCSVGEKEHRNTAALDQLMNPTGPGAEGLFYSSWYNPFYSLLLAWRIAYGEDYFRLSFYQHWPLHLAHLSGNDFEWQDKYPQLERRDHRQGATSYLRVLGYLEAGLAPTNRLMAGVCKEFGSQDWKFQRVGAIGVYLLTADPTIQKVSREQLPKSYHFIGVNNICSRQSWFGTNATCFRFTSPLWMRRELGPPGNVQLWKNGGFILANHAQVHDYDGGNRTNTLVLYKGDSPGVTYIPRGSLDNAKVYDVGVRFDLGQSVTRLSPKRQGYNDGLKLVRETDEYLLIINEGEYRFVGTRGSVKDPEYFDFTKDDGMLWWRRMVVWFPAAEILCVHDVTDALERDYVVHGRWNFHYEPEVNDNRVVVENTLVTDWGLAQAKGVLDFFGTEHITTIGGLEERNSDIFGCKCRRNMPLDLKLGERNPQNVIHGLWRIQTRFMQPQLAVIQALDLKQIPQKVNATASDESFEANFSGGKKPWKVRVNRDGEVRFA